jgi:hypothetical protein
MYCSSCGSAITQGASFCQRCGSKLTGGKGRKIGKPAKASPDGLVWALVSVLIAGFGLVIGLTTVLKKEIGFSDDIVLLFAVLSFALVVAVSGGFLWMLVRGAHDEVEAELPEHTGIRPANEIGAAQAHLLNAPPASVVEGTTRTLEPEAREGHGKVKSLDTSGRSRFEVSP